MMHRHNVWDEVDGATRPPVEDTENLTAEERARREFLEEELYDATWGLGDGKQAA